VNGRALETTDWDSLGRSQRWTRGAARGALRRVFHPFDALTEATRARQVAPSEPKVRECAKGSHPRKNFKKSPYHPDFQNSDKASVVVFDLLVLSEPRYA